MLSTLLLSEITKDEIPAIEITSLTQDTRLSNATSVFVCIRGARFDGHTLAPRAYENGCRLFVAEKAIALPSDATVVLVPSTRKSLALLARRFYGDPSRALHVIGITGTKGKTTTASLIRDVLNENNIPCGYIGTNGITYGDVKKTTLNTTPDALTLQETLAKMKMAGMRAVAMEVSSQALLQDRVFGVHFETTVFTNFSKDHIGPNEHSDMEDYKACKHRLFTDFDATFSVWNCDDPTTEDMKKNAVATRHIFYSAQNSLATVFAKDAHPCARNERLGISFSLLCKEKEALCHLPLIGLCNVSNALCAAAVATEVFGIPLDDAARALSHATVAGRSECYPLASGATVVIDYAHNKESLHQILSSLREYHPRRLYCLFGSVGERTQLRRRDLAEVAASLSDECIITSDNPGNEPPERIVDEIASYLPKGFPHEKIADRTQAIQSTIKRLEKGDILLLAGKGHENYQLIGNDKIPFDEREIIKEFLLAPSML